MSQTNVAGLKGLFKEKSILIEDLSISEKLPPKIEAVDQKPISTVPNPGLTQNAPLSLLIRFVLPILSLAVSKWVEVGVFKTFI